MSDNWIWALIILALVMCAGEPDMIDSISNWINPAACECSQVASDQQMLMETSIGKANALTIELAKCKENESW